MNLQKILWRILWKYWLTVFTYGLIYASYNAVKAMIKCVDDNAAVYPTAAKADAFYMDDMLKSLPGGL